MSETNPHLRKLAAFAHIGMLLGVVGGLFTAVLTHSFGVAFPALIIFSLGFLAYLGDLIAAAISWNAPAIATDQ